MWGHWNFQKNPLCVKLTLKILEKNSCVCLWDIELFTKKLFPCVYVKTLKISKNPLCVSIEHWIFEKNSPVCVKTLKKFRKILCVCLLNIELFRKIPLCVKLTMKNFGEKNLVCVRHWTFHKKSFPLCVCVWRHWKFQKILYVCVCETLNFSQKSFSPVCVRTLKISEKSCVWNLWDIKIFFRKNNSPVWVWGFSEKYVSRMTLTLKILRTKFRCVSVRH